ncbi:MAG: SDR family oxidoreductase [Pseudolabrys sp.]|nr:SDR family oxidoreductase [Pseudolabrys sp.]
MTKRRICILGGCGGIGRSLVTSLLANGDDVAVMDLPQVLDRHPPSPGVIAIAVEGSNEDSVRRAFDELATRWGALDGFVNAAGFVIEKRKLVDTPTSEFDITMSGNLRTTFLACKAAMALLDKGNAPSMVNIASGLGAFIRPDFGPYAAAKAGMIALTKTFALEHAPKVRANCVAPGPVDTAFLRGGTAAAEQSKSHADINAFNALIPLRRIAVPEDIVGPVMFLLGPQSAYMTGQTLWLNGGAYMP